MVRIETFSKLPDAECSFVICRICTEDHANILESQRYIIQLDFLKSFSLGVLAQTDIKLFRVTDNVALT